MTVSAERLLDALFERPDAFGRCDGCEDDEVALLQLPNCDDELMFCLGCFSGDDDRGRRWRERLMEWWEESKEEA